MYKVWKKGISPLLAIIFAVAGVALLLLWFSHSSVAVQAVLIVAYLLLIVRFLTNQYITIDVAKSMTSKPCCLFFRRQEEDPGLSQEFQIEKDDHGKASYKMVVTGDFGTKVFPVTYEQYMDTLYNKIAVDLKLA